MVLPAPTLALASPGPSHPVPGLTRCPISDPSRPLGPHPVSEGVGSLNLRLYVPFSVPNPDKQTSPRSLLSQSFQLLCASPAFPPCPGPWLSPWSSETFLLPARFPSHSLSLNVQFQPSPLFSETACCVTCEGRGVVEENHFTWGPYDLTLNVPQIWVRLRIPLSSCNVVQGIFSVDREQGIWTLTRAFPFVASSLLLCIFVCICIYGFCLPPATTE